MKELRVAVLGATGLVGRQLIAGLQERRFPVSELIPAASQGGDRTVGFGGEDIPVQRARFKTLAQADLLFNCAGAGASRTYLVELAKRETVCIDKSSAFRQHSRVPLVIPEVNGDLLRQHKRIIASPNCEHFRVTARSIIRAKS